MPGPEKMDARQRGLTLPTATEIWYGTRVPLQNAFSTRSSLWGAFFFSCSSCSLGSSEISVRRIGLRLFT